MSYADVRSQIKEGVPPEVICTTCPWSRPCMSPPDISSRQVTDAIRDMEREGRKKGINPAQAILAAASVYGGRDSAAQLCPVLLVRFTGPDGRRIADGMRETMRNWQEAPT